jgi:hypothetical protein
VSPLRRGAHEHVPGHVYHWRHGWVPLDYPTALHAAGGNARAANRMLADAHGKDAGIRSGADVEHAAAGLSTIRRPGERAAARGQVVFAAQKHDAQDVIPAAWQKPRPESHRTLNLDQIEQKMTAAVEAGDDTAVDRYAGMMEKREAYERSAADTRQRKRDEVHAARSARYDELVSAGKDDADAYADAFAVPIERVRRGEAVQLLGGRGDSAREFNERSRADHDALVERQWKAAEDATNGYMVNKAGERRGVSARSLFTSNDATARKYATPELRQWWDDHGRVTLAEHRAELLDPTSAARMRHARADYLQ